MSFYRAGYDPRDRSGKPVRMRSNPLLTDVRLLTNGKRDRYLAKVWDMLVYSYEKIGIPHKHPSELLADYPLWELWFGSERDPHTFILYKQTEWGLKRAASGSDDTRDGRETSRHAIQTGFVPGIYGEVSEGVEHIALKAGVPVVCSCDVERILGKRITPLADGMHYEREITGVGLKTKILAGYPKGVRVVRYTDNACPVHGNPRKIAKRKPYTRGTRE